jgi:hypothetical protein
MEQSMSIKKVYKKAVKGFPARSKCKGGINQVGGVIRHKGKFYGITIELIEQPPKELK